MATYGEWYPSNYFKSDDLDNGAVTLTISKVQPEQMKDGEMKPCVHFREDKRKLVLNVVNKNTLVLLTKSNDPADAAGTRVQLVQVDSEFQGKPCKAIRIRAAAIGAPARPKAGPTKAAPAARAQPADEVDPDLNDELPY